MDPEIIQAGATIITAITAVVVPIIVYRLSRRSYGLRWVVLPPESMMEIAEDVASSVSIYYELRKIDNLLRFQFILHNTGTTPLRMKDITSPLTWEAPGRIIKAQILETDPPVNIDLEETGKIGDHLVVKWKLFNQGCKAVIEVICEGKAIDRNKKIDDGWQDADKITAQIAHIPEVKIKKIMRQNPDEVIRRMKANFSMKTKLQRRLQKIAYNRFIYYNRFIILNSHALAWTYVFCTIMLSPTLALLLETIETKNSLTAAAFILVVVAEAITVSRLWRNQYSSILLKALRKRQSESI